MKSAIHEVKLILFLKTHHRKKRIIGICSQKAEDGAGDSASHSPRRATRFSRIVPPWHQPRIFQETKRKTGRGNAEEELRRRNEAKSGAEKQKIISLKNKKYKVFLLFSWCSGFQFHRTSWPALNFPFLAADESRLLRNC